MDFSDKIDAFLKDKNLTAKKLCEKMDNYSETLFSKQRKAKIASPTLVLTMAKYFDIDFNYFFKTEDMQGVLNEPETNYITENQQLIENIENSLAKLKKNMRDQSI